MEEKPSPTTDRHLIRVLIAEDHLLARAGIRAVVNTQPDMKIVGAAVNGLQAVSMYRTLRPDVTLMDMWMPVMDGFDAIVAIRKDFPSARIISLSTFGGDEDIRRALLVGAQAYLTKGVQHDELIGAIRAVNFGERYVSGGVAAALANATGLTEREVDVLRLIVQGLSNKLIAADLGIAEDTAKNHIRKILKKLGVDDRTQAATAAIRRGFVHLQD